MNILCHMKNLKKILSKNFNFLYFNEHWGGLKKNKQKIQNFKIKSFDILLERKELNIMIHAIILARGGSKTIKNKNLKKINGKP